MNQWRAISIFSLASLVVVPLSVWAADMPLLSSGWSLVPEACRACPCGFAGVMGTVQNLVNSGISFGILFAVIIIAWAGFLYITTPTNPEARSQANKMLINAAIGLLIICSAWLIVDFVMKTLYAGEDNQHGKFGPWNSILTGGDICVEAKTTQPLFSGAITAAQLATSVPAGVGSVGGPKCSPPASSNNPCSVAKMEQSCFASRASDASIICNMESAGGNFTAESGSDKLNNGSGPSYSVGLWQINLTIHKITKGGKTLNCPAAFTNPCKKGYYTDQTNHPGWCNSAIINTAEAKALYAQCVAAAKDPVVSTQAACDMDQNRDFSDWACSASRCRVSSRTLSGGCAPGK